MKILIAEDDEALAREIQMACTRWDFTVDTVQDFQQIAETLAQLKPDLLLLDINLPYYDGFYWCETIRRCSMLPILFISSRDQDQDKIMAMMSGGDDYLQKKARGYAVPESFNHGTSAQRGRWLRKGLSTGRVSDGDTFALDYTAL